MTDMQRQQAGMGYPQVSADEPEPTGWVGWIWFAGIMMVLLGSFQAIAGLVALFQKSYYVVANTSHLVLHLNYTGWGWLHLILGILAVAGGVGVMSGQMWARIYAVFIACLSAIANIAFLAASPIWSTIMITIDVLVIWAVTVHGREVKAY